MTDNKIAGQAGAKPSRWWLWLLIVAIIAIAAYFLFKPSGDAAANGGPQAGQGASGGGKGGGKRGGGGGIPVVVTATAKSGDIAVRLDGLGAVTPMATVTVKTHVDGELMKVLFTEGQVVKQGQLIAIVDPRPYQVQLEQAEGTMAHDQALLKNAQVDLERYRTLYKQDSIAEQQLATQDALVRQYEAQTKVDRGAIDSAKLNLVYCNITAPVTGRVGLRQVDPGNIVHAADTNGIVVITQLQPITVVFSIPEDNIPDVMQKLQSGTKLDVDTYDRSQKVKLASGKLLTVDNQIDPSTGTVKLKASFANEDNALFPQQFVNARLLVDTKHNMTLIPTAGVQRGSQGTYVYAVNADNTVSLRLIKVGITEGDTTAIVDGVKPGDVVVTEGADKLRDGAKVEVGAPPATGAAGSGSGSGGHGHHNKDGAAGPASASASAGSAAAPAASALAPAAAASAPATSDAASAPAGDSGNGEHHHHRKDASSSANASASSN
jgi:multidrug efflux system membrane fusion protein